MLVCATKKGREKLGEGRRDLLVQLTTVTILEVSPCYQQIRRYWIITPCSFHHDKHLEKTTTPSAMDAPDPSVVATWTSYTGDGTTL